MDCGIWIYGGVQVSDDRDVIVMIWGATVSLCEIIAIPVLGLTAVVFCVTKLRFHN